MNESIELLSKILDCTTLRQKVLANNLANSNTPGFKRMDVEFRGILAAAVEAHGTGAIRAVKPEITEDKTVRSKSDGNTVSMQKEMGEMMENALLYQFATKAVGMKLEGLRKAARGQ